MLSKKLRNRIALALVSTTAVFSHTVVTTYPASAAEIIRQVFENVQIENSEEDGIPWYIPGVRKYRCELIADMPSRTGGPAKTCSYNCRGYGGGASFPWPSSLPCPKGYNELMPPWPDGYPGSPYPSERRPSIYAD